MFFIKYMGVHEIIGKTFSRVAFDNEDQSITFIENNGTKYTMVHQQDCCENVCITDIAGNLEDLENSPILGAEESTSDWPVDQDADSVTWTFYKFRTRKGYVDITWRGESNGYYSEGVSFGTIEDTNVINERN